MQVLLAKKSDKKAILRFYKAQHYAARFLGFDNCYLIKKDDEIIASVIVSGLIASSSVAFLHALVVDNQHRHQGAATQLLRHALSLHAPLICFAQPALRPLYLSVNMKLMSADNISANLPEHLLTRFNAYQNTQPTLEVYYYQ